MAADRVSCVVLACSLVLTIIISDAGGHPATAGVDPRENREAQLLEAARKVNPELATALLMDAAHRNQNQRHFQHRSYGNSPAEGPTAQQQQPQPQEQPAAPCPKSRAFQLKQASHPITTVQPPQTTTQPHNTGFTCNGSNGFFFSHQHIHHHQHCFGAPSPATANNTVDAAMAGRIN